MKEYPALAISSEVVSTTKVMKLRTMKVGFEFRVLLFVLHANRAPYCMRYTVDGIPNQPDDFRCPRPNSFSKNAFLKNYRTSRLRSIEMRVRVERLQLRSFWQLSDCLRATVTSIHDKICERAASATGCAGENSALLSFS